MSGFDTTLDVLMASENRDVPRLLGHVLTRGDMRLRRRAVERLLATTDGRRQMLLVRHFKSLGTHLERTVYEQIGHMGAGLRAAMNTRDPRMQAVVVEIVRDTGDASLAYLVGEATNSSDESVRGKAVDLLWRWSADIRRQEMKEDGPADIVLGEAFTRRRRFMLEGLQRAFTMRRAAETPRILSAAAMLADSWATWFWSAMGIRRDARRRALVRNLRERFGPEMLAFAVRALERESIAAEAASLLAKPCDRRGLEALLREFNRHGRLSKSAMRHLREAPWLGAGEAALEQVPSNLVATALALAVGSGMPRKRLAIVCRGIAVNHAEAEARRVALDTLSHCGDAATEEFRVAACTAPNPSAGTAVLHLTRRGELGELSVELVAKLLRDWWDLAETDRREVGRGLTPMLRSHPELLRHHLIAGSRTRRAAVGLVRAAQVADVFSPQIRLLASDVADTQLQSAALTAAAESMGEGIVEVLRRGLDSWDARVRANALEALDRREARDDVFLQFMSDPSHRVRANAALALIERDRAEGRATLRQMLTGSEDERLSALWVFSRTRPSGFVRTAGLLANQDPSQRVRQKAGELLASA